MCVCACEPKAAPAAAGQLALGTDIYCRRQARQSRLSLLSRRNFHAGTPLVGGETAAVAETQELQTVKVCIRRHSVERDPEV